MVVVAQPFNPSPGEAEAGGPLLIRGSLVYTDYLTLLPKQKSLRFLSCPNHISGALKPHSCTVHTQNMLWGVLLDNTTSRAKAALDFRKVGGE